MVWKITFVLSFVISAKKGVNTESLHQIFFKLIYMIILYAYIIETTLWKIWSARYQDICEMIFEFTYYYSFSEFVNMILGNL